jgi:hypothetical protein
MSAAKVKREDSKAIAAGCEGVKEESSRKYPETIKKKETETHEILARNI